MSILIANRTVRLNDRLYHVGMQAWGTIESIDPSGTSVTLVIRQNSQSRRLQVINGGVIAGIRQAYWHEPVALDLPVSDITTIQQVVNVLAQRGVA